MSRIPTPPAGDGLAAPPRIGLAQWLRELDDQSDQGRRERRLGITGHLLLDRDEESNVIRQLRQKLLPQLFPDEAAEPVCLLSGLAPGADLLFTQVAADWLRERGLQCRIVGLLPVPLHTLLGDWADNAAEVGADPAPAVLLERQEQVRRAIASCDTVIDLMPPGSSLGALRAESFRQDQYRRLAACLAERSDLLVAILREGQVLRPGGTAEAAHWRCHPQLIPAQYSTRPKRARSRASTRLIVIDPAAHAERAEPAESRQPAGSQGDSDA